MPYSKVWDEAAPAGTSDANKLDDAQRDGRTAIRERLADVFGGMSLAEFQADPLKLRGLKGGADADFEVLGGTSTTSLKNSTGTNNDLQIDHTTGDVTVRRDINGVGGYHQTFTGWEVTNIAAAIAATEVPRIGGRALMVAAGSVLGIVVALAAAQVRTAGTLTVEVWRSTIAVGTGVRTDTALGLTAIIDATNAAVKVTVQAKDLDIFNAGDEIFLKYSTDAGWLPVTADLTASVLVES